MEKVSQKDIDWLLQPKDNFNFYKKEVENAPVKKKSNRKGILYYLSGFIFYTLSFSILPFFILIRTAVYLNVEQALNGWFSLLGGIGVCVLFLSLLSFFILRKVKNKKIFYRMVSSSIAALVFGFCVYGVLYLNSVNAKSDAIQDVYSTLHPILRVAVASTTLAEKDLVITDIKRTEEDYISWGLTPLESSMHYVQDNGFVHAIDLRTIGHSEFRNTALEWSLKLMGFQTIRHVGTADHLHVALPLSSQ